MLNKFIIALICSASLGASVGGAVSLFDSSVNRRNANSWSEPQRPQNYSAFADSAKSVLLESGHFAFGKEASDVAEDEQIVNAQSAPPPKVLSVASLDGVITVSLANDAGEVSALTLGETSSEGWKILEVSQDFNEIVLANSDQEVTVNLFGNN